MSSSATPQSSNVPVAGSVDPEPTVRIQALKKRYDDFWALKGLDLEISAGELFGFLGPNGAGKTTTMTILAGLLQPTEGRASICGFDVVTAPVQAKQHTGYIPDRPHLYEKLTGNEFVEVLGDMYGVGEARLQGLKAHWLAEMGLADKANALVESYSHGMRQRLVLAATLVVEPRVLVIDEPTVGLDPSGARVFKRAMREACERGVTVLMSTHSMSVAEECCDRIGIMNHGELLGVGTVDQLRTLTDLSCGSLEDIFFALTDTHR